MVKRTGSAGRNVAAGLAVACVVGLGLLAVPSGAGAAPELPPISAEDLLASVAKAKPEAFNGTVGLENALGLPALPNLPQAGNGESTARVWSDGDGRGRVQLPSADGERTLVSDGTTFWAWDSSTRTVTKHSEGAHKGSEPDVDATDPTGAATEAINRLRSTSQIRVDGTAEVAGRPAYELVLAPAAQERTLLREVRIAIDSEKRVPLRLTVLSNGSNDPALQLGFTDLSFGPQDAKLFTFTPPPGTKVEEGGKHDQPQRPQQREGIEPTVVGDGWDTVLVAKRPEGAPAGKDEQGGVDLNALGTPVSGAWGSGRLITTAVASVIVTDDGRIAMGAVPEQVLTEALAK
ncbi:outer membrane lipoprotein carrier protein LolA [Actinomycetes bacterium KLBMP 9759]